jgi:pyrrolidone-carboxylate peptidase
VPHATPISSAAAPLPLAPARSGSADRQGVSSGGIIRPADVPRRLLREPVVTHSGNAGGFFCEHAFFTAQTVARQAAVLANRHGEPLVGFLHVPGAYDRWLGDVPTAPADPARRHARTLRVVGRALAGFVAEAVASGQVTAGPVRLLLTGFGPWGAVTDNPTGDLVGRRDLLATALDQGFGGTCQALTAPPLPATLSSTWAWLAAYAVPMPAGGRQEVWLCGWTLPTSDEALDPAHPRSLPQAICGPLQPHAVLSLGVARRRRRFYVEHTAADVNLLDGRHQDAPARTVLPANFALARAIRCGGQMEANG